MDRIRSREPNKTILTRCMPPAPPEKLLINLFLKSPENLHLQVLTPQGVTPNSPFITYKDASDIGKYEINSLTLYHKVLFMSMHTEKLRTQIRAWIVFFIVALLLSGLTAFPVETELGWLYSRLPWENTAFTKWLNTVYQAIKNTNDQYPYLAYGYDWLAFAHIVIAIAFIGPLKDPVKNIWIIEFGRIACIAVIPLAFIAGHIRQIPFYWQLIDCSFGIIGLIPLSICHKKIKQLEKAMLK